MNTLAMKKEMVIIVLMVIQTSVLFINKVSAQTITSFSPSSGPIGSTVTITGTNFSATPTNNIVYFGATRGIATSATATELEVTVPAGATYQPISVLVNGLTAYSSAPFIVTFSGGGEIVETSFHATQVDSIQGSGRMAIADLDGDGKSDLVTVTSDGNCGTHNKVSVFRNTSTTGEIDASSFSSGVDFDIGPYAFSFAIGDLDGDGKPDLVVGLGGCGTSMFSIFKNTSVVGSITESSFAAKVDFIAGLTPTNVKIGDIDGDGKPDLVMTNRDANTFSVFRNSSSTGVISASSFQAGVDFTVAYGYKNIAIGDLDGDKKADLAVTSMRIFNGFLLQENRVSILRNTSVSGTITENSFANQIDLVLDSSPSDVAIGDLDEDGQPELVVVKNNSFSIFRNTSTPGTITENSFADKVDFDALSAGNVAIGDLDGDGKPDLTLSRSSLLSIFRNVTTAGTITQNSFATKVDFATEPGSFAVAIGDLDGNGKPELVVRDGNSMRIFQNLIPRLAITSFSPTAGPTGTSVTITGIAFDPTPANNTLKFNGAAATVTASTSTSLTSTVPDGATTGPITVMVGDSTTTSPSNFIVSNIGSFSPVSGPVGTTVTITGTDFDTIPANNTVAFNGVPATVTASTATSITTTVPSGATTGVIAVTANGITSLSENSFTVTPAPITSFSPTSGPIGTTVLIAGAAFDPTPSNNMVFFGATRATVTEATPTQLTVTVPAGAITQPISVTVSSLTASSIAPFVVTFSGRETIYSTGYPGQAYVSDVFSILAVGDLDGDSKPDLATSDIYGGPLSILRNTTTPGAITATSFPNKVDFNASARPVAFTNIAIGDLDGDGKSELVIAHAYDTVSVFKNNSITGTISASSLGPRIDIARGRLFLDDVLSLAIADMDGDGKKDLILVLYDRERDRGKISILRNIGVSGSITRSSFAPGVDFKINGRPSYLAINDLDVDGKPDLVIFGGMLAILRNTCVPGAITGSSLEPQVDFTAAGSVQSVDVGDLDGDGKPELVMSAIEPGGYDYHKHLVSIHQNMGTQGEITTSSFVEKVTFQVGLLPDTHFPRQVAIGDLDGDGRPELVVIASHEIILPFQCKGSDYFYPCIGDFLDYTVSGFKNNSTIGEITASSFGPKVDFTESVSDSPFGIDINDIDGDGRTDLLVSYGYHFSILSVCNPPGKPTITQTGTNPFPHGGAILTSSPGDTYQWYWNGTPYYSGHDTNPSLATPANGLYTVRVNVNSCLSAFSDPFRPIVTGTVSANSELSVYPIPAHEQLFVKGASLNSGNWGVVNMLGLESQPPVQLSQEGSLIDIRELTSGVYILVANDGKKIVRVKFIKE